MIKKKPYDGVVTAVRYDKYGEIEWVRAFERHGYVFSDRVMLDRDTLVNYLREGKRFKTGERIVYQGNDFKIEDDVRLIEDNDRTKIVTGKLSSDHDSLGNLPII